MRDRRVRAARRIGFLRNRTPRRSTAGPAARARTSVGGVCERARRRTRLPDRALPARVGIFVAMAPGAIVGRLDSRDPGRADAPEQGAMGARKVERLGQANSHLGYFSSTLPAPRNRTSQLRR